MGPSSLVRQRRNSQLPELPVSSYSGIGEGGRGSFFRTEQLARVGETQDRSDGVLPPTLQV